MTYNFDPDRWYENQRALLETRREREEIDEETFSRELDKLERKYERMLERLDGTYRLPRR